MFTLGAFALALLAVTWGLYPGVMWMLAKLIGRRPASWSGELPSVSVVVATRDTPEKIAARVHDILRAAYPAERMTVVVGLDLVSGELNQASYSFPDSRVRFVGPAGGRGKAAALNAAVAACDSELLVFTDTAQRFHPDAIRHLVDSLGDPRLGVVSGALHTDGDGATRRLVDVYWRFERALRRNEATVHSGVGVTGAIYVMRRALWSPLPEGLILDDVFVPMRTVLRGHRVGFREDAIAYDRRRFQPEDEYRRKVRTLTGVLQLCAWLPEVLLPVRNPVWLQFVFHKLLRFATPVLLVLALLALFAVAARVSTAIIATAIAATLLVALVVMATRRGRRMLKEGILMQLALLEAVRNAARGQWNVWNA